MESGKYEYPTLSEIYTLPFGILGCFFLAGVIIKSGSSIVFVLGAAFMILVGVENIVSLIVCLFFAPASLSIDGEELKLTRAVGKDFRIKISSITSIERKGWLDMVISHTIMIRTVDKHMSCFFLKENLGGLQHLVGELKRLNKEIAVVGEKLSNRPTH